MTKGVFSVILNDQQNKILLVKRRDVPLWDLPGGRLEDGESLEDCGIRETLEETGYKIKIHKKVGVYNRRDGHDQQTLFTASIVGGQNIGSGDETQMVSWKPIKQLPLLMIPNRKLQIRYFLNGHYPEDHILKETQLMQKLKRVVVKLRH